MPAGQRIDPAAARSLSDRRQGVNGSILIGNKIVNLFRVVWAEFTEAHPGGEWDEDEQKLTAPRPAELIITLSSVDLKTYSEGYNDIKVAAASASERIKVKGEAAQATWEYLCMMAVDPVLLSESPF
jgi:hypothetical protein